jgi:hypothetical protein
MIIIQSIIFVIGALTVIGTVSSAIRTFVVPRGEQVYLTRLVFSLVRRIFNLGLSRAKTYEDRDRIMAYYAPLSVLALPPVWLLLVAFGFTGMFWALGVASPIDALELSGSSLVTLGFVPANGLLQMLLAFIEAGIGLVLVALFISYLPTMYSAFQRRESLVTMLEVRAGSPPSAVEMLERFHRIHGLNGLAEMWISWEAWFADVEESHTSLASLIYFRSPSPKRHWVTAAGAVLDCAALVASSVDIPRDARADLCLRAGYLAFRAIGDLLNFRYDPDPQSTDAISVTRQEFDAACERLIQVGVPIKQDRDQAWHDFSGWRVNYDELLLALADVTISPYAPWSSDRCKNKARELRLRPFIKK